MIYTTEISSPNGWCRLLLAASLSSLMAAPVSVFAEEQPAQAGGAAPPSAWNPYPAAPGAAPPPPPGPYSSGPAHVTPQFRPDPDLESATGDHAHAPGMPHEFEKKEAPGALTRQQFMAQQEERRKEMEKMQQERQAEMEKRVAEMQKRIDEQQAQLEAERNKQMAEMPMPPGGQPQGREDLQKRWEEQKAEQDKRWEEQKAEQAKRWEEQQAEREQRVQQMQSEQDKRIGSRQQQAADIATVTPTPAVQQPPAAAPPAYGYGYPPPRGGYGYAYPPRPYGYAAPPGWGGYPQQYPAPAAPAAAGAEQTR